MKISIFGGQSRAIVYGSSMKLALAECAFKSHSIWLRNALWGHSSIQETMPHYSAWQGWV